jgi:hypothetical protein
VKVIEQLTPTFDPLQILDLLIQQEEMLREQLIRTRQLRQQVELMIPNSPFTQFIRDELEIPGEQSQ